MSFVTRLTTRSPALRRLVRYALRDRCAVLMYHGVTPAPLSVFNWCHIPANLFRAQMLYLKAHYRVLPLSEIVTLIEQRRTFPPNTACITFDDAFRSVLEFAFPVLQELELPFTVFVVTQLLDTGAPPWPERLFSAVVRTSLPSVEWRGRIWTTATADERGACYREWVEELGRLPPERRDAELPELLDLLGQNSAPPDPLFATMQPDELRRMTGSGLCQIGAHSETHAVLTQCNPARLEQEVLNARNRLRDEPGYTNIFAYPHGQYDSNVLAVVKAAGFRAAVTVEHRLCGRSAPLYELPRIGIGAACDLDAFAGLMLAL